MKDTLTDKQKRFVQRYVRTGSMSGAYSEVYANAKSAEAASLCGARLMACENIRAYYKELCSAVNIDKIADEKEIMRMYSAIIRGERPDYALSNTKEGRELTEVPVKASDLIRAGEALLKRIDIAAEDGKAEDGQCGVVLMPDIGA